MRWKTRTDDRGARMRRRALLAAATASLGVAAPPAGALPLPGVPAITAQEPVVALPECLWQRNDPALLNVLYPDAGAVYFSLRLPAPPPGVRYRLRGQFPHARYASYTSYSALPIDALLDEHIPPDAGSTNPFVPGADRTAAARSYTVRLAVEPPPADPAQRAPGTLYVAGGALPLPVQLQVIYRLYVPDRGRGLTGGVPLPRIEAVGAGPLDLSALTCPNARDALPEVQEAYAEATLPIEPPIAWPTAENPPVWTVESGLTAALAGRAGQDGVVSGGPASNPHNRYLTATVARGHGEVLAIRGRAPTTPRTEDGEPVMGSGDLRYWSFCQNSRSTRYVACLADHEMALEPDGSYVLAISAPEQRPSTARNWLPFGPELSGEVLYRHMLPSAAFRPRSAQGVEESGAAVEEAMGPYFPRAAYCSRARFERDACGLPSP